MSPTSKRSITATAKLSNGVEMPRIAVGMAFWNVVPGAIAHHPKFVGFLPEQAYQSLTLALTAGIRAIDTALIYRSQTMIRSVLGSRFAQGSIQRSELFVTTKVFHFHSPFGTSSTQMPQDQDDMTPEQVTVEVERQVEQCFEELGLGYIDLMLLHWPASANSQSPRNAARRRAAWKVLERYYNKGWLRAIGVSNWSEHHLQQLMDDDPGDDADTPNTATTIKPMVNQVEASVYLQWNDIVKYCHDNDIQVQAFSPLGHGAASVIRDPVVQSIAARYNKDAGQVAFRYLVQKGYALTFSSLSPKRLETNQEIFDFSLTDEEMTQLNALNGTADSTGQPSPYDMS